MELLLHPAGTKRLNIDRVSSISPSEVPEGQTDDESSLSGRLDAAVKIAVIKAWVGEREVPRFTKVNLGFGLGGSCFRS